MFVRTLVEQCHKRDCATFSGKLERDLKTRLVNLMCDSILKDLDVQGTLLFHLLYKF